MAGKKLPTAAAIPEVDVNALVAADPSTDIVDVNALPAPAPLSELPIHTGIVASGVDIDPEDSAAIESMLGKSAAAMTAAESDAQGITPDDGEFVKVFYHPNTRRYVQFNQALLDRQDFQLKRVRKEDFGKLNLVA